MSEPDTRTVTMPVHAIPDKTAKMTRPSQTFLYHNYLKGDPDWVWGYYVIRTVYTEGSDELMEQCLKKLSEAIMHEKTFEMRDRAELYLGAEALAQHNEALRSGSTEPPPKLDRAPIRDMMRRFRLIVIESKEELEYVTTPEDCIKEIQKHVAEEGWKKDIEKRFAIWIDEESMRSVLAAPALGEDVVISAQDLEAQHWVKVIQTYPLNSPVPGSLFPIVYQKDGYRGWVKAPLLLFEDFVSMATSGSGLAEVYPGKDAAGRDRVYGWEEFEDAEPHEGDDGEWQVIAENPVTGHLMKMHRETMDIKHFDKEGRVIPTNNA